MWHLLVSQILFPSLAMMSQTGLSGEGVRKVWLPFPLPNLSIQHASVVSGGQGLPMAVNKPYNFDVNGPPVS